jgi:flagellar assembly protein FliH
VSDSTLSRGDFYLRNEYSELDGTLKTRVMNLLSAHLGSLTLDIIEDE